jgi:hypothetical protein
VLPPVKPSTQHPLPSRFPTLIPVGDRPKTGSRSNGSGYGKLGVLSFVGMMEAKNDSDSSLMRRLPVPNVPAQQRRGTGHEKPIRRPSQVQRLVRRRPRSRR